MLDLQSWMEQHASDPISMTELAARGAMSLRSLNRRFRAATGLTPIEYLHRVRIETAKRLLEASDASVEQITARVGYSDARSFGRLFRTLAGVSPREYRARFGARG